MAITNLVRATTGDTVRIIGIAGGRAARLRLVTMGLREGMLLRIAHGSGSGPIVVERSGTRLVLGIGMAEKIMIDTDTAELAASN